jgi:hypothetical protein
VETEMCPDFQPIDHGRGRNLVDEARFSPRWGISNRGYLGIFTPWLARRSRHPATL